MRKRSLRLSRLPQMVSNFVIFIFFRCLARYSKTFIFFFFFDEKKTRLDLNQVHCCHPRSHKIFSLVSNVKDVASYLLS